MRSAKRGPPVLNGLQVRADALRRVGALTAELDDARARAAEQLEPYLVLLLYAQEHLSATSERGERFREACFRRKSNKKKCKKCIFEN